MCPVIKVCLLFSTERVAWQHLFRKFSLFYSEYFLFSSLAAFHRYSLVASWNLCAQFAFYNNSIFFFASENKTCFFSEVIERTGTCTVKTTVFETVCAQTSFSTFQDRCATQCPLSPRLITTWRRTSARQRTQCPFDSSFTFIFSKLSAFKSVSELKSFLFICEINKPL